MRELWEHVMHEIGQKCGTVPPDRSPDLATRLWLRDAYGDSSASEPVDPEPPLTG